MCGIFGTIDFAKRPWIPPQDFHKVLSHRGPDAFGIEFFNNGPNVILAHNRLSIIDLSSCGKQPMPNEDSTVWITFNGEIYNYEPLREELINKGHVFRSTTDTEVIVHLYEDEGIDCLQKLNGMFAFGIWDKNLERLFLARDRLGVKPLVYFADKERCIFGSEIKALQIHPAFTRELDWEALELYFTFNFIPAPWTIFKKIRKLLPGHYLIFDRNQMEMVKYWEINDKLAIIEDVEEAAEKVREVISDATKIRLFSDVPLGAFLSGGIDSSIVVANMARNSSQRIKTYLLGYEEDKLFDETPYARAVAEMYGTDHHEIRISQKDILKVIPDVLSFFDEPFADSSALPTYIVSREIRKHVTVAMSGDGGDEIFGGYRRYLGEHYLKYYMSIPGLLRKGIINPLLELLPDSKGNKYLELIRRLKIFARGASDNKTDRHYAWMALFPDDDRMRVLSKEVLQVFKDRGRKCIANLMPGNEYDEINRSLLTDFRFLLPYDMLNKVDWMSMKNSLEVRSPLLDYRVAELAFHLPGNFKVKPTRLKFILKYAFRDWLPKSLWNRPKQGFEIPIGEWFKREQSLQDMFWQMVSSKNEIFDIEAVKFVFDEHQRSRRDNSHKLWAIFVFCWWLDGSYGVDPL